MTFIASFWPSRFLYEVAHDVKHLPWDCNGVSRLCTDITRDIRVMYGPRMLLGTMVR